MERVGIEIDFLGYDKFQSQLAKAQQTIKKIEKDGQIKLSLDFKQGPKGLRAQRDALRNEIKLMSSEINSAMADLYSLKNVGALHGKGSAEYKALSKSLRATYKDALSNFGDNEIELQAHINNIIIDKMKTEAARQKMEAAMALNPIVNYRAAFTYGKQKWGMIGTSLETFGNALSNIGNNPISQVVIGGLRQMGSAISGIAYQGLSQSIDRYNTLSQYPKLMKEMGFSEAQAAESTDKLRNSVRGLPTKLNDIVAESNKYVSAMGDIEKGTDLAIAANYAYLASSSTEQQRMRGNVQLNNLVSGAELTRKQWMALWASMPLAMAKIGEKMGYDTSEEFQKALYAGQIDNKKFLDAMIGTDALKGLADISKQSLNGAIENLRTSFSIAGANLIEALNDGLIAATGKDLPATIYDIGVKIQDWSSNMKSFLKANPQIFKEWIDRIKQFDIVGFIRSFAEGMQSSMDLLFRLGKHLPSEKSIGWILGYAPVAGRVVTAMGQIIKSTSIIGGFIGMGGAFIKSRRGGGSVIDGVINFFSKLRKTKGAKDMATAGTELASSATAASTGMSAASGAFKGLLKSLGGVLAVSTTIMVVVGEIYAISKVLEKAADLDGHGMLEGFFKLAAVATVFGTLAAVMAPIGTAIAAAQTAVFQAAAGIEMLVVAVGLIVTTIGGFAALDTWLFKKATDNIVAIVEGLDKAAEISKASDWDLTAMDNIAKGISDLATLAGQVDPFSAAFDKWASGNIKEVADNVVGIANSFKKISDTLATLSAPPADTKTKLTQIGEMMGEFMRVLQDDLDDVFDMGFWDDTGVNNKEAANLNGLLEKVNTAVNSVISFGNSLQAAKKMLNDITATPNGAESTVLDAIKEDAIALIGGIGDLYDALIAELDTIGEKQASKIATLTTDMATVVTNLQSVVSSMTAAKTDLANIVSADKNGAVPIDLITENIKTFFDKMATLFSEIQRKANVMKSRTQKAAKAMEPIPPMLDSVRSAITKMLEMRKDLNAITAQNAEGDVASATIAGEIATLMTDIKAIVKSVNDASLTSDVSTRISVLRDAMSYMVDAMKNIVLVQNEMANIGTGDASVATKLKTMIDEMSKVLDSVTVEGGLAAKIATFKSALESLKTALQGVATGEGISFGSLKTSIEGVGTALDSVTAKMGTAGAEWTESLKKGINIKGVKKYIESGMKISLRPSGSAAGATFRAGLISQLQNLTATVKVYGDFTSAYSSLWAYRNAASSPIALAARLALGGGQAVSTGGFITRNGVTHFARGGSVFRRRGIDTIPAMLAEGEYVVNRGGVRAFGLDFMRSVNRQDYYGALNALSMRMGGMLPNISPNVVNNTTNNNQSVTQHINTNNPNYTYRRANRFVRALN